MKRVLTIGSILSLVMASSAMAGTYGWNLSGSDTIAFQNTGPAVASTPFSVYLWLACVNAPGDGMSAAEFSISHSYFDAGFTPTGGALNAGNSVDVLLAVGGCPGAGTILGFWAFIDFTGVGGSACLVASPGGVNGTVDCDTVNPLVHPNEISGYSTDGSTPCQSGLCGPVSVESTSWGSIKGLYR